MYSFTIQGKVYEISNESWDYCVFIPDYGQSRVFGIGPEVDWTKVYDEAFSTSDKIYQVLSICLLEVSFQRVFYHN